MELHYNRQHIILKIRKFFLTGKILSFILNAPEDTRQALADRARDRRLMMNLSQEGLARRAGISTGTIKRFEKTGHVSIDSLLKIALVLEALDEFEAIFKPKARVPVSIDELIEAPHKPQRGRLK